MGIFKVSNIYFLGAFLGFFLVTFRLWAQCFGFFTTLIIGIAGLSITITYIGISNSYPTGFFRYWVQFKNEPQVFIPGFEPVKNSPQRGK